MCMRAIALSSTGSTSSCAAPCRRTGNAIAEHALQPTASGALAQEQRRQAAGLSSRSFGGLLLQAVAITVALEVVAYYLNLSRDLFFAVWTHAATHYVNRGHVLYARPLD